MSVLFSEIEKLSLKLFCKPVTRYCTIHTFYFYEFPWRKLFAEMKIHYPEWTGHDGCCCTLIQNCKILQNKIKLKLWGHINP